jgi:hypothetical protein
MAMGGSDEFSALLVSLRQVAMVTARVLLARPANQVPAGNAHLSGAIVPNVRAFPVVSLMTLEGFRGDILGWFSRPHAELRGACCVALEIFAAILFGKLLRRNIRQPGLGSIPAAVRLAINDSAPVIPEPLPPWVAAADATTHAAASKPVPPKGPAAESTRLWPFR